MIEKLIQLIIGTDPAAKWMHEEVTDRIRTSLDGLLNGDIDRAEFERRLFTFDEMSKLPIGHLLDHRVHMPAERANELLSMNVSAISDHYSNMLCSTHAQGAEMIAEALRLDPEYDAHLLLEMSSLFPEFTTACLSGRHYMFPGVPKSGDKTTRERLNRIFVSTALYFGALQSQLIAIRQRAIEEFHVGTHDGRQRHTIGALYDENRQMARALKKARDAVFSDKKLRGRPHNLFSQLETATKSLLTRIYLTRGITEAQLLQELRTLFTPLSPRIDLIDSLHNPPKSASRAERERQSALDRSEMRTRITTVLGGGVTGGEQIAFASLRLHAFSRRLRKIVSGDTKWPTRHEQWFMNLAGRQNNEVAKLILVNRSAVWINSQDPSAFSPTGMPYDLRSTLKLSTDKGKIPGEELLDKTKTKSQNWKEVQQAPSADQYLAGAQLWDIHPESYLGSVTPLTTETNSQAIPNSEWQTSLTKSHLPSPRYRAPRKSHHNY